MSCASGSARSIKGGDSCQFHVSLRVDDFSVFFDTRYVYIDDPRLHGGRITKKVLQSLVKEDALSAIGRTSERSEMQRKFVRVRVGAEQRKGVLSQHYVNTFQGRYDN